MRSKSTSRGCQAQVCSCALVFAAILFAVSIAGCGSGGQAASDSGAGAAARGAVSVVIPGSGGQGARASTVLGRAIPATTQSFLILVRRDGVQVAETRVQRTAQDQVVTISDIPVGLVDVIIRALDSSGATVAEATLAGYQVVAGTNPAVTVTLTPVAPTGSPTATYRAIYVLNGSGANRSNKISIITVPPSGSPTCAAAVDVSLTSNANATPAGMVRWGTYQSPNPQPTSYLYVTSSIPGGGNVNRFAIASGTGFLTGQAEQALPLVAGSTPTPAFIGPARNTTSSSYTPPPYLYVLSRSVYGGESQPFSVGAGGALSLGSTGSIPSSATSLSLLPDMTWAYLSAQGSIASFSVGTGGALAFQQSDSGNQMTDSLVNATGAYRYVYFLDATSNNLCYYALNGTGSMILPVSSFPLPDSPSRMCLVSRADFPAGEQYLYIACSTTIHCCRLQNGVPTALNPATGYSLSTVGTTLSPSGGLDSDPRGQALWVAGTDASNNSHVSVFSIAPQPGSSGSPGILVPWTGMPIPVTDGAGTQMKGASGIVVKD